jgi:hypothetical protein
VAVADGQGAGDGLLGLLGGDLADAEAEDRHLDAVVEGDGGDLDRHVWPAALARCQTPLMPVSMWVRKEMPERGERITEGAVP